MILRRSIGDGQRITGTLQVSDFFFATIERPWLPNPNAKGGIPRESCVPTGLYAVVPHHTTNFPNTYALVNHDLGVYHQPTDVPPGQTGRAAILMHVANRVRDVVGCIGIGLEHGVLGGEPAILKSTLAMRQLDAILGRHNHTLEIT